MQPCMLCARWTTIIMSREIGAMVLNATMVGDTNMQTLTLVAPMTPAGEPNEIMRDPASFGELVDSDAQKTLMLDGASELKRPKQPNVDDCRKHGLTHLPQVYHLLSCPHGLTIHVQ